MYSKDDDDQIISESAEYSSKSDFSKPKLVEEAVRKVIEARSKEMKEGYYNYKIITEGPPLRVWIPDQREIYNSTVEALISLLAPEIEKNKAYKTLAKKIADEKDEVFEHYCYTQLKYSLSKEDQVVYEKTGMRYIPTKGEKVLIITPKPHNQIDATEIRGAWDRNVDFYLEEIVTLNDRLFSALNKLIANLNYFKQQARF